MFLSTRERWDDFTYADIVLSRLYNKAQIAKNCIKTTMHYADDEIFLL